MAKYSIRESKMEFKMVEKDLGTPTMSSYKLINTNDMLGYYSHVLFNTDPTAEDTDGEFVVFNAPSSLPAKKFYLEVIHMAEIRNMDKKNGKHDGFITITDIASVVAKINNSPYRISHGRIFLQLTGSKITDILPGKIECWYKFPTDNAYMVICKSRPNLIEIMPGDMKFNKEVVDENVDNKTTN